MPLDVALGPLWDGTSLRRKPFVRHAAAAKLRVYAPVFCSTHGRLP